MESVRKKFHEQKSAGNEFHEQNQFGEENKKSMYKFHEDKKNNIQQVSRRKISLQQVSTNKNEHATSPKNKISFTRRKIYVHVSRKEQSICNNFHEQKLAPNKLYRQKSARKKSHE